MSAPVVGGLTILRIKRKRDEDVPDVLGMLRIAHNHVHFRILTLALAFSCGTEFKEKLKEEEVRTRCVPVRGDCRCKDLENFARGRVEGALLI
jgi:hypothetical protein